MRTIHHSFSLYLTHYIFFHEVSDTFSRLIVSSSATLFNFDILNDNLKLRLELFLQKFNLLLLVRHALRSLIRVRFTVPPIVKVDIFAQHFSPIYTTAAHWVVIIDVIHLVHVKKLLHFILNRI